MQDDAYVAALRFRWLTRFYDPVVALTTRENIFRRRLLEQITAINPDSLLDLACGTGTLARMVKQENSATTIHGLDGDPDILELARRHARNEGRDIRFDQGMSFAMPYPDGIFDVVVSSLFFHHLNATDKRRTLAEIRRVLKPGGQFLVCDWGKPANPLLRLAFYLVQILDGFEVTRDNVQGLLPEFVAAAGFDQVVVTERISTMLGTLDLMTASNPV